MAEAAREVSTDVDLKIWLKTQVAKANYRHGDLVINQILTTLTIFPFLNVKKVMILVFVDDLNFPFLKVKM